MPTPVFNILKRGVQFFVASLMSNKVKVNYEPLNNRDDMNELLNISQIATQEVDNLFDKFKMDNRIRDGLFDSAVCGDVACHIYFDVNSRPYNGLLSSAMGEIELELVDGSNVYFGNPNTPLINTKTQPYIIISGRDTVKNLQEECKQYKANIQVTSDNDTYDMSGEDGKIELDGDDNGKAKYILYYYYDKETKTIKVSKLVENNYIYKDVDTELSQYPIAWLPWEKQKNNYHGRSACTSMISNQIFINRMFAMVMYHLMLSAFPKTVYDKDRISNWNNEIGTAIGVSGLMHGESIKHLVDTIEPSNMSNQIIQAIELTMQYTKETLGINETMLGDINPEQASSKSIIATVKQGAVPLENPKANLYEWIEDIGRILLDMMGTKYGIRPLVVTNEQGLKEVIDFDFSLLKQVYLYTRCDVGTTSYWSEISTVEMLENLFNQGAITIIEMLESIPNDRISNKQELISKIKERLSNTPPPNGAMPGEVPNMPMPQM